VVDWFNQNSLPPCVCNSSLDLQIYIYNPMRGGVVQDQVVKMFYKNVAHITWLQATKSTKGRAFIHRHIQTLLLMDLVSTAPYIKGAQHCSPSCLYHKVTGLIEI